MFALKPTRSLILSGLVTLLFTAGCAVRVQQDFDPTTDFVQFRTFHVVEKPRTAPSDPRVITPFAAARIRTSLEAALVEHGFRKATADEADFIVGYHFDLAQQLVGTSSGSSFGSHGHSSFRGRRFGKRSGRGFGRGFGYGGGHGVSNTRVTNEGTLIIDIADRDKKMLAWRGWGSARVGSRLSPKKIDEAVVKLLPEILAQFPPLPEDEYARNE